MPEYGRYKQALSYRKRGFLDYTEQGINTIFSAAADIGSTYRKIKNYNAQKDAEAQAEQDRIDSIYESSNQNIFDKYDSAMDSYIERNRNNEGIAAPVALDDMTLDAFRSLVPDADQESFDVWKRRRNYSQSDSDNHLGYYAVNVYDNKIDGDSNYKTRAQDIRKQIADKAESVSKNNLSILDDALDEYWFNDGSGSSDYGLASSGGFFSRMTAESSDYTRYGELTMQEFEKITPEWLSQQFDVPESDASKWIDENIEQFKIKVNSHLMAAIDRSATAQIENAVDNARTISIENSIGRSFSDAWNDYVSGINNAGAGNLRGFNIEDEFVSFTNSYATANLEAGIDVNPTISNADIDKIVDSFYDNIRSANSDIYTEKEGDFINQKKSLKSHLYSYRDKSEEEQSDELERLSAETSLWMNGMWENGIAVSDSDIYDMMGIDLANANSLQIQSAIPLIKENARQRAIHTLNPDITDTFNLLGEASISLPDNEQGITITMNSETMLRNSMDEAAAQNYDDYIAKAKQASEEINADWELRKNISPISEGGYNPNMQNIAPVVHSAKVSGELRRWTATYDPSAIEYNGEGEPEDGDSIYVANGDAFYSALSSTGVDITDTPTVMKLASIWNNGRQNALDKSEFDEVRKSTVNILKEMIPVATEDDFKSAVDIAYQNNKISNTDRESLLSDFSSNESEKQFIADYNSYVDNIVTYILGEDSTEQDSVSMKYILQNDDILENKLRSYSASHNGDLPTINEVLPEISDLITEESAKSLRKAQNEIKFCMLSNPAMLPEGTIIDNSSSARDDFLSLQRGDFNLWAFDDEWYNDIRITYESGMLSEENLIEAGVRELEKLSKLPEGTLEWKDLSNTDRNVIIKNASVAAYIYGYTSSLKGALGDIAKNHDIVSVVSGSTGDLGILDRTTGILYDYPDTRNQGQIRMRYIGNAELQQNGSNLIVSQNVLKSADAVLWNRGWNYEIRRIMSENGTSVDDAVYELQAKDYMTADDNLEYQICLRNLIRSSR